MKLVDLDGTAERRALLKASAVLRILAGRSTPAMEAVKHSVSVDHVSEWLQASHRAIATALLAHAGPESAD